MTAWPRVQALPGPLPAGPGLTSLPVWLAAPPTYAVVRRCSLPRPRHLVVDVQLVVLPGLQGLVQVQVTLDRVILEDVAPARKEGLCMALSG